MKLVWPVLVFGIAFLLALAVLHWQRAKAWYWHILSLALAVGIALVPDPRGRLPVAANWDENIFYLAMGFICVFLLVWGAGGPFFRGPRGGRAR